LNHHYEHNQTNQEGGHEPFRFPKNQDDGKHRNAHYELCFCVHRRPSSYFFALGFGFGLAFAFAALALSALAPITES